MTLDALQTRPATGEHDAGAAHIAVESGGGLVELTIKPTGKALRLLKALKTLHVLVTLAFTPTGGTTNHASLRLKITAPKPKHHPRGHRA